MASSLLSTENPVFMNFLFHSGVVLLKTMVMSAWTGYWRVTTLTFANEEDYAHMKPKKPSVEAQEAVERIRRCHLNDLENVYPFVLLGFLYVLTNPNPGTALLVFRCFTIARLLHTIVYVNVFPQPSRVLMFMVGFAINVYMGAVVISKGKW